MRLAFGHPFAVELRHLLDEVVIVQQDRPVRADGERVLVAFDRDAGIRRRRYRLCVGHFHAFRWWVKRFAEPNGRGPRVAMTGLFDASSSGVQLVHVRHREQIAVEDFSDPHHYSPKAVTHIRSLSSDCCSLLCR